MPIPSPALPTHGGRAMERVTAWLWLPLGAALPATLVWDFSWESTVGIDPPWSPPHTALNLVFLCALLAALGLVLSAKREDADDVRLGYFAAPLTAWVVLWGAIAFLTAVLFDTWWQKAYGLAAGIWGPPQWLKTAAFFAVLIGVWMRAAEERRPAAFSIAGGSLLALISMVTLASMYANRQHSAAFYELAAATYPLALAAQATAGRGRWPATAAALCYTLLWGAFEWILPLFRAEPLVAPIINPLDHMLPPPFALLLIGPALAFDLLWRVFPARGSSRASAIEAGLAFFLVFLVLQWTFSGFLLSPASEGRFFAGGGRWWPFYLQINPAAMRTYWHTPEEALTLPRTLFALALAILSTAAGRRLGTWMKEAHR